MQDSDFVCLLVWHLTLRQHNKTAGKRKPLLESNCLIDEDL